MSYQEIDVNQKMFWVELITSYGHKIINHANPVEDGYSPLDGLNLSLTSQAKVDAAYAPRGIFKTATLVELSLTEAAQAICPECPEHYMAASITVNELAALRDAGVVTLTPKGIVVNR